MESNQLYCEELARNVEDVLKRYKLPKMKTLEESGAGKNFISNIRGNGSFPSVQKFVALSDFTGISVDEFLGRSDISATSINGNVTGIGVVQDVSGGTIIGNNHERTMNAQEAELIRIYNALDAKGQIDLMVAAFSLIGESNKN